MTFFHICFYRDCVRILNIFFTDIVGCLIHLTPTTPTIIVVAVVPCGHNVLLSSRLSSFQPPIHIGGYGHLPLYFEVFFGVMTVYAAFRPCTIV